MKKVVVFQGLVTEIPVWDGATPWTPPQGAIVNAPDDAAIGWTYKNGVFAPPPTSSGTLRVSKADFQRLLTPTERYKLNALRKTIASLLPEDYGDPANQLIVAAEDVMFAFEQPLEFIELDHPDTAMGLALLGYLGIVTPARIAQIVTNQQPA